MNALFKQIFTVLLLAFALVGCAAVPPAGKRALAPTVIATVPGSATRSDSTGKRDLFYLHGNIIEDQGIPAISPEYGEYQYQAILDQLSGYGFEIISEINYVILAGCNAEMVDSLKNSHMSLNGNVLSIYDGRIVPGYFFNRR
jgi:hypothetical protein